MKGNSSSLLYPDPDSIACVLAYWCLLDVYSDYLLFFIRNILCSDNSITIFIAGY